MNLALMEIKLFPLLLQLNDFQCIESENANLNFRNLVVKKLSVYKIECF